MITLSSLQNTNVNSAYTSIIFNNCTYYIDNKSETTKNISDKYNITLCYSSYKIIDEITDLSPYSYRQVSPVLDIPKSLEIDNQKNAFENIDNDYIDTENNVINKYDSNLKEYVKLEILEKPLTYWTDLVNQKYKLMDNNLSFYEQKETFKLFDYFSYNIDNSYLDKIYHKLYNAFDNVRKYNEDSKNLIKTFTNYVSEDLDSCAIVFEGLKENEINYIDNESYINVYLKHLRLTNEDIFFKTSSNVSIDYDGKIHFINYDTGFITAYSTADTNINKTIQVKPTYLNNIIGEINSKSLDNNTITINAYMIVDNSKEDSLNVTANSYVVPSKYANYTKEIIIKFDKETFDISKKYICKIFYDKYNSAESDFTKPIFITSNTSTNLIYSNVNVIDKYRIKLSFVINSLTLNTLIKRKFNIKIYEENSNDIKFSFESYFKGYKTIKPSIQSKSNMSNPLKIKLESEFDYFKNFSKTGAILETNKKYEICIDESCGILSSLYVTNSTGGISTIIPKHKLTSNIAGEIVALGKGSFDIHYSVCDNNGDIKSYVDSFIVNAKPVSHSVDNISINVETSRITIKLEKLENFMSPISIIAQYNLYDKKSNYYDKNLIKGFKTNYFYDNEKWAEIEIDTTENINNIPIRIYFVGYDNVILYKDYSLSNTPNTFSSRLSNDEIFVDSLGNEYGKNLKQPLYNVSKENHISPFVKVSLGLSKEPFDYDKPFASVQDVTGTSLKYSFKTDVLGKTNGMPLSLAQQKEILAIERKTSYSYICEGSTYSLYKLLNINVDEYLASQGFDSSEKIYTPSSLSYVASLKNNSKLNVLSNDNNISMTPIYSFDKIEDNDEINVWNVIPNIKLNNPSILFDISENYNKIRHGCVYKANEKNFDIVMSKNTLIDSEFTGNNIEIKITENDILNISFDIVLKNIVLNGQIKTVYNIDESSIYINGILDNKRISSKYVSNCSRDKSTGNISINSLDDGSFTIVVSSLGSRKRVSLTFVVDEYNIVNDDLLIDINETGKINKHDYASYTGQYMQNSYTDYNTLPTYASNVWLSYGALNDALNSTGDKKYEKKIALLKSSTLSEPETNSYILCDIKNKIITQRYITYNTISSGLSDSFVKSTIRMPIDLTRIVLTDEYYNALFDNADILPISKDYEYNLCFDTEYILKRYKLFNNSETLPILGFETSDDGVEYVYDDSDEDIKENTKTELKSILLNIHILCQNKLRLIYKNVPITGTFSFCYNELFKKYGHINGLVISDKNNNPLHSFSINVSFEPFIKANIVTKRIFDTPILFFDDASSEIKYNSDYDNLLPSFTQYRESLNNNTTYENKIGYLSKYEWNSSYTFGIIEKKYPIIKKSSSNWIYDYITLENNEQMMQQSIQYIGYFMYYLNMSILKHLNWNKLTDSEDLIYYIVLLDKLNNSTETFTKFKDLKDLENIKNIKDIHIYNDKEYMTVDYFEFFERNYDKILSFWKSRIEAYSLLEDILNEYDETLSITEQIDKYIDKLDNVDNVKREKIYFILTQTSKSNNDNTSWAVSQIANRLWDGTSMHYIWKNVFDIMFEDQFDLSIINDAILRDIYNYGFYPIINIPEMTDNNIFIPYNLDINDGEIKEYINDSNEYIWNIASEKTYEYITNGITISGISRTLNLETPEFRTWKFKKEALIDVLDKNENAYYEYEIENADENGWGILVCKNKKYDINIKGEFKSAKSGKTNLYKKTIEKYKEITESEILNKWIDNFYCIQLDDEKVILNEKIQLDNEITLDNIKTEDRILKLNLFTGIYSNVKVYIEVNSSLVVENWKENTYYYYEDNTYKLFEEIPTELPSNVFIKREQQYDKVSPSFVIENWKENTFYYYEDDTYKLFEEIPTELPSNAFIKNIFYKLANDIKYYKPSIICYERLIGREYTKTFNYTKPDFYKYWLDEDKANLIKMKQVNLLEMIKIQRFLSELFLSELNKSMNMVHSLILFSDMKEIVNNVNKCWEEKKQINETPKIVKDYNKLLDFNIESVMPTYNCIYPEFSYWLGTYTYSYQYYNGYNHVIDNNYGYGFIDVQLPKLSAKRNFIKNIYVHDDEISLNITVPQNNIPVKKTAEISYNISGSIPYVWVEPINSAYGIEPFGIYPYNANTYNFSYISSYNNIYSMPTSWASSFKDLTGLINYRDYEKISKYKYIDPDGWKNSMFTMNNIFSGNMEDCPAVRIAYNFYPEDFSGTKYSYIRYTYDFVSYSYTILRNRQALVETDSINVTYKCEPTSSDTGTTIYGYDLYLYPKTDVNLNHTYTYTNLIEIGRKQLPTSYSYSIYTYTYSYVKTSLPTYTTYFSYTSYSYMLKTINFNKLTNTISSYMSGYNVGSSGSDSSGSDSSGSGYLISNTNRFKFPTNNASYFTVMTLNNMNISNVLFGEETNNSTNNILSETNYRYTINFSYGYTSENITLSSDEYSYSYLMYNSLNDLMNSYNITTYNLQIYSNIPTTSYTVHNKIHFDSDEKTKNIEMYKSYSFFLGSVSQWQVVQDNAREINDALSYISYAKNLVRKPDYFYDGRIDRDIPSSKLFWTSSEIDSCNAWMMFFDKNSITNNSKNCSAYVRPFMKKEES